MDWHPIQEESNAVSGFVLLKLGYTLTPLGPLVMSECPPSPVLYITLDGAGQTCI